MANATGEVVEVPTEFLPFKAVISIDGKIVRETYLASRRSAEAFLAMTLEKLAKTEQAGEISTAGAVTGAVVETPTQHLPFKAVISAEGKVIHERFFATRAEAEASLAETLKLLAISPQNEVGFG